jgi:hypothetical protein
MRHFIARYLLAAIVMICALAGNASAAHPKKLCFNNNHQFKIVQFSDLHLVWQDGAFRLRLPMYRPSGEG